MGKYIISKEFYFFFYGAFVKKINVLRLLIINKWINKYKNKKKYK